MYWNTGQPGTDPEILIKIILLGPLFNIRSVRQTVERSFADGKKLHGLRFTFYRGNEAVDRANLLAENDSLHSIFSILCRAERLELVGHKKRRTHPLFANGFVNSLRLPNKVR
ncbi:transposase [Exiguobacterium alkaliphilum]|uniref:transposase n=1 Tax=Exiguobacterium alkaliphilum TaxID=1428684 RepID=UPI0023EDBFC9|nr:transposase [Exiguobacterium alkaliphilum]